MKDSDAIIERFEKACRTNGYRTSEDATAIEYANARAALAAAVAPPAFIERMAALEAENARLKADRLYIVGCNDGYDAAMEQAAEFCDGAEASWRETADKAHELDHNEAMGWSTAATAKAETCAGLAYTIRTASVHPLIRGVGLCMLDGKDADARTTIQEHAEDGERQGDEG